MILDYNCSLIGYSFKNWPNLGRCKRRRWHIQDMIKNCCCPLTLRQRVWDFKVFVHMPVNILVSACYVCLAYFFRVLNTCCRTGFGSTPFSVDRSTHDMSSKSSCDLCDSLLICISWQSWRVSLRKASPHAVK